MSAMLRLPLIRSAYTRDPQESKERLLGHLKRILPDEGGKALLKVIG